MNNDAARAEQLSLELESSFRNRADLYRLIYDELASQFGEAQAEDVLVRAIEKRGREVAATAFVKFGANDARRIGEAFLAVSPDGGRMYPTNVERGPKGISFQVKRCPLKDAWVEAGIAEDRLATLCRIAGAFDRGLFEATGIRFSNRTWQVGDGPHCCFIQLADRDAA